MFCKNNTVLFFISLSRVESLRMAFFTLPLTFKYDVPSKLTKNLVYVLPDLSFYRHYLFEPSCSRKITTKSSLPGAGEMEAIASP